MILMGMAELMLLLLSQTEPITEISMIPTESGPDFSGVTGITMALSPEDRILAAVFMTPALAITNTS